jgi:acyl dehydratase
MPGVMVVEAMVQVGGVLASFMPGAEGKTAFFAAIERCRFRRPVRPGDTLITEVTVLRARSRMGQMQATARVDGMVVADGVFTYSLGIIESGPGAAAPEEDAPGRRSARGTSLPGHQGPAHGDAEPDEREAVRRGGR